MCEEVFIEDYDVKVTCLLDKKLQLLCLFLNSLSLGHGYLFMLSSLFVFVCLGGAAVWARAHTSLSRFGLAGCISIGILRSSSAEKANTDWFSLIYAIPLLYSQSIFVFFLNCPFLLPWPHIDLYLFSFISELHAQHLLVRCIYLIGCICLCAENKLVPVQAELTSLIFNLQELLLCQGNM